MQVRRWLPAVVMTLGACTGLAPACLADDVLEPHEANGLLRYFMDSNRVFVRSYVEDYSVPLGNDFGLGLHWNNERVTVPGVEAAPGTSEAVDAITTASRPITGNAFQDFIKTRNEFTGRLQRRNASVEYYHSIESDYLAHKLGGSWNLDWNVEQINLAFGTSWAWDDIEPVADDDTQTTADRKTTLHWNAVATQVLRPTTVLRYGVEMNQVSGLQHNPYRRVWAGGSTAPERHPDRRSRRDAFVKLSQYLQNRSSLRLDYRYYTDDWGIASHETSTKLSQYITSGVYAQYDYRWYTQSAADFWRAEYVATNGVNGYLTGDYRLGPLSSHLFGVALNFDLGVLAANSPTLRHLNLSVDYERYFNSNNYSADILETGIDFRF